MKSDAVIRDTSSLSYATGDGALARNNIGRRYAKSTLIQRRGYCYYCRYVTLRAKTADEDVKSRAQHDDYGDGG